MAAPFSQKYMHTDGNLQEPANVQVFCMLELKNEISYAMEEVRGTSWLKKARSALQMSSMNLVGKLWTTLTFVLVLKFSN